MPDSPLIACCECDLLQRAIAVPPHTAARCRRCDAVLYRNTDGGLDRARALSIAAIALFVIGNLFPIVGIEVRGEYVEMTLIGAVQTLYVQQELLVATLVLATVVAAPTFELIALCTSCCLCITAVRRAICRLHSASCSACASGAWWTCFFSACW